MRRLVRWFWITIALVFLFEAWLWDHLQPTVGWIVDRLPLHHLTERISKWVARLSPALSLIVFIVPLGLLLPFKLAGLWLLARGYWMGAAGTLFFAKIVGLGSTAFVFDAARQKLLQLDWFRRLYDIVMEWRAWAHELADPVKERIKARMAMFAPHRAGRAVRLLLRIRRRVRTPLHAAKLERPEAAGT
jgi:hypothetical protein